MWTSFNSTMFTTRFFYRHFHGFYLVVYLHMANLVGDREGRGKTVVLDNRARRSSWAHTAKLCKTQGVASLLSGIVAQVFSRKIHFNMIVNYMPRHRPPVVQFKWRIFFFPLYLMLYSLTVRIYLPHLERKNN